MDEDFTNYYKAFSDSLPKEADSIKEVVDYGIKIGSGDVLTIFPNERNSAFRDSQYFEDTARSFVHFTSVPSLISICNEGFIRMSTLNSANDPDEVLFSVKRKFPELASTHILEEYQKDVFSLSLCDEEKVRDLNLWRFYGGNGNGVALHLKVANSPINWSNFHLSKIFYGEENFSALSSYLNHLNSFEFRDKVYPMLTPLLAFHKSKIFKSEAEYRLMSYAPGGSRPNPNYILRNVSNGLALPIIKPLMAKHGQTGRYMMIPLGNSFTDKHGFFLSGPRLVLTGVTLGFNYTEEFAENLETVIHEALNEGFTERTDQFRNSGPDAMSMFQAFPLPKVQLSGLKNKFRV